VKCIKRANGNIERVPDFQAAREVKEGRALFVAKTTWKQLVRNPERGEIDKRILAKLSKGTIKVGDKIKFHVEGTIQPSEDSPFLTGKRVGEHMKAKERRVKEQKRGRRS
jgi:hypothetical protein